MSCKLILYTQTSYAHAVLQRINRDRPYVVGLQFFNLICRAILGLEGYRELKKKRPLYSFSYNFILSSSIFIKFGM